MRSSSSKSTGGTKTEPPVSAIPKRNRTIGVPKENPIVGGTKSEPPTRAVPNRNRPAEITGTKSEPVSGGTKSEPPESVIPKRNHTIGIPKENSNIAVPKVNRNKSIGSKSEPLLYRGTKSEPREFWFDEAAADRAVQFFAKCLCHVKGEWKGQPFILSDWQADQIIRPLFGWKRKDGTRKYRTCLIQIPRKAGKSMLAAGIAAYLLFSDNEPAAEVYSAAVDREQARIVFDMCKSMIDGSKPLRDRATVYKQSIVVPSTGSSYKVLSSDSNSKHGFSASGTGPQGDRALQDQSASACFKKPRMPAASTLSVLPLAWPALTRIRFQIRPITTRSRE